MKRILAKIFDLYRRFVSPVLHSLAGPGAACRFHPTCSEYAEQAVRERGLLMGGILALWRIVRCNPLFSGGFDPVPSRGRTKGE
jgi:uncharacterized protein